MARRGTRRAKPAPQSRKRARYSPAELFVAILGLGFLALAVGMVVSWLLG